MKNITKNLRYLRKSKKLTQFELAEKLEIKRSLIGAYEEGRADPKYDLLTKMAKFYNVTIDDLINEEINEEWVPKAKGNSRSVRILSITVDKDENENIELVPVKASAGYLTGYGDPEYISQLPKFNLPMFKNGSYRAFELKGDSMLPLQQGTVIIGEYQESWHGIKPGQTYIVISKSDGVVYKRISDQFDDVKGLKLTSDNPVYEPFWIATEDILEIWKAKAYISVDFPEPEKEASLETLTSLMIDMQKKIIDLKGS